MFRIRFIVNENNGIGIAIANLGGVIFASVVGKVVLYVVCIEYCAYRCVAFNKGATISCSSVGMVNEG